MCTAPGNPHYGSNLSYFSLAFLFPPPSSLLSPLSIFAGGPSGQRKARGLCQLWALSRAKEGRLRQRWKQKLWEGNCVVTQPKYCAGMSTGWKGVKSCDRWRCVTFKLLFLCYFSTSSTTLLNFRLIYIVTDVGGSEFTQCLNNHLDCWKISSCLIFCVGRATHK